MKIGITCYPTYGGSGAVATELGLELARRGHEVHFITYASPFRLRGYAERVYFHEVETTMGRYPLFEHYPYTLALASKQHEVALREKLDLLHVHYAIPHATTAWLAREMLKGEGRQLKVITTLHGTDITLVGQEASFYAITKFSIEQSDMVTAVSTYLRDETYRAFGCVSCDVGVDSQLREPRRIPSRSRATVGRARAGRAPPDHAHLQLPRSEARQGRDPRLRPHPPRHAGDARDGGRRPRASRCGAEAKRTGGGGGRAVPRPARLGGHAAAGERTVPPAVQTETFGLAALEAMACGAVVVATRVGGIPEVVDDGVDGILEPVGSVEAMGRRAVDLLRDPDALARHARGRHRAGRRVLGRPHRADVRGALRRRDAVSGLSGVSDLVAAGILGLVEGVTEFIPVSSTGHLILAGELLGRTTETWKTFEIVIQLGAILAVVWIYRELLPQRGARPRPRRAASRKFILNLLAGFLPAAVVGLAARDWIKAHLFQGNTVAWGLILGGVRASCWSRGSRRGPASRAPRSSRSSTAFGVGLAQVLALYPGISRSGATIMGGYALGLLPEGGRRVLLLPGGAGDVRGHGARPLQEPRTCSASPTCRCSRSAWWCRSSARSWCSEAFLRFVSTRSFVPFALYRLALGALILFLGSRAA